MRILHCLCMLVTLSGCAGFGQIERVSSLSVEELKALNQIQLLEKEPRSSYHSVGKVKGLSCKGSPVSGDTKEKAAMTQLKIKALKLNAEAVLYPTCSHDASVDWGNNCWESWVCIGEAIQYN